MFVYMARLFVIIAGPVIGYMRISPDSRGILIGTGAAVIVIGAEIVIEKVRLDDMIAGIIGIILGLIAASLLNCVIPALIDNARVIEIFSQYDLLISVVFAYIGMIIALRKKGELDQLDRNIQLTKKKLVKGVKVVDSSAVIDGRLLDVAETGFIEGVFVIPTFIIEEVQALADSGREEERKKARRALDIVKNLRENENITTKIYEKDYAEIDAADSKLIKICHELKAKLVTCDFNLNKAAAAQGIGALNINELANSLKPKLLPGEAVNIFILKKGKGKDQGVGYLEDGTMVVVDGAVSYIGKEVEVTVKSVLQKPSGRMIFARVS
ncbi:MAG: TRAM domain-containing protein [Elusimicrobiota bacterium]|nr:TRAM domain-containing protein [Elusimicrobiota bacterium]